MLKKFFIVKESQILFYLSEKKTSKVLQKTNQE